MLTTSKHKVRYRSLSFCGNKAPSWMVPLTSSRAYEVVTQEPSQSIKDPLGGKEHNPWASHFLWKYLTGNSLCAGYIRFSYCKHWDALPGLKVKASNVGSRLGDSMTDYLDSDVGGELRQAVLYHEVKHTTRHCSIHSPPERKRVLRQQQNSPSGGLTPAEPRWERYDAFVSDPLVLCRSPFLFRMTSGFIKALTSLH